MLQQSSYTLDSNGFWDRALDITNTPDLSTLEFFDQSGYALSSLELLYAEANDAFINPNREKQGIYKPWILLDNKTSGVHVNHSWLLERKGYTGEAKEQLDKWSKDIPLFYKVSKLKPKWGIDISFDYVNEEGLVMELFHYEWDSHIFEEVIDTKEKIEKIIYNTDWEDFANKKLARKSEWKDLNFVEQSKWTTQVLDLPPENFKMVPWLID
jgi:hypothetical protein